MTVSIRIAGKLVHVSNVAARTAQVDVGSAALFRRVRLDAAAIQSLRSMLVNEVGAVVQRMADPLVVEEAAKRVASGRWTLSVVDAPQLRAIGSLTGQSNASGGGKSSPKSGTDLTSETAKTWVEVELLDRFKRPVKGLAIEVTLPDGTVEPGVLSEKGAFRKSGIDPGTCRVTFPDLDGREWAKTSNFADGEAVSLLSGKTTIAPGPYTVKQGDHIASIAADAGFLSWKTVWEDGANGEIKGKRNPNVLYPGDVLEIPERTKKQENIPTTEYSTFQTVGDPLQLKIVVLDWSGTPVVDTEVDIELEGGEKVKTAGDGGAMKKVVDPQGPRVGKLTVQGHELILKVGHLDPVEELSGKAGRLNNLGYSAGSPKDEKDIKFLSAVEEFQCDYGLKVDGNCGPVTQAKLKEVHGS